MRVGIVTIHHATNYGAVWQAYALSQAIRRLGFEPEVIDYRPWIAEHRYRRRFRGLVRAALTFRKPPVAEYRRFREFDRFIGSRLTLGPDRCRTEADLSAAASRYRGIIAGSDQIWCTGAGSFRGFDSNLFLGFCPKPEIAKISYAASAGDTSSFDPHADEIRRLLQGFSALSVRDLPTARLVEAAAGRAPTVVLDPVFLHDFNEIVGDAPSGEDLILFAEHMGRLEGLAVEVARRAKLRLVVIDGASRAAAENHRVVSPEAWLRHLKSARAVLTDYFHGTAVALKFGKPVLVYPAPGKYSKISDLLQRVGLMSLLSDGRPESVSSFLEAARQPREFAERVAGQLEPHVASSLRFLQDALTAALVKTSSPAKPVAAGAGRPT